MKALLITNCSDGMLWYRDKVGAIVPFTVEYEDCFMSREPAGYRNIVNKQDAIMIEVPDESTLCKILRKEI